MPTNIETKARIRDFDEAVERIERLAQTPPEVTAQEDVFFCVPTGRLKLRVFGPCSGELIYYNRPDTPGPSRSDYVLSPTTDPESLKAALSASLGIRGVVRKSRWLYMVGNTRVHLDQVEGLGAFLELEVVLALGQGEEQGQATAAQLMTQLAIRRCDLVEGAYIDLLEGQSANS